MRGGEHDPGVGPATAGPTHAVPLGRLEPDGRVRTHDDAVALVRPGHPGQRGVVVDARGAERRRRGVRPQRVDALVVRGGTDVHRVGQRRDGRWEVEGRTATREPLDQVGVGVVRRDEARGRRAHGGCEHAGRQVAEVARRDDDDGLRRVDACPGELRQPPGVEGRLRQPTPEVDAVGAREGQVGELGVAERLLDQPLAVVEAPLDGERVHARAYGRQLRTLHRAHTVTGEQHDHPQAGHAGHAGRDRAAGVARGGDEHQGLAPVAREDASPPAPERAGGHVLEGTRGPVEELQQPGLVVEAAQRDREVERGTRVLEPAVGLVVGEPRGERRLGSRGQRRGRAPAGRDLRHPVGDVEAAVGREPAEQRVLERDAGTPGVAGADEARPGRHARGGAAAPGVAGDASGGDATAGAGRGPGSPRAACSTSAKTALAVT